MDVRYLLLLFLFISCMPSAKVGSGNLSSDGTTSDDATSTIPESATQWNYLGNLSSAITINVSNLNNSYIVGKNIETFLGTSTNFSEDYCMVSRYTISGSVYELRTRAVPISYYDFTAKRTVRILRADFNDVTNSQNVCGSLPLKVLDSNGVLVTDSAIIAAKTANPTLLCTTCSSNLSSSKIIVFKKALAALEELSLAQVDVRALTLTVDPNNNASTGGGTCSASECAARGYDCCLDNQCITDGAVKPTASTLYSSQLASAEQERLNNPMAYLNYPNLYYICGSSVPSTTGGSSGGSYVQGLTQLKKDYFCVEHMKKYKTGSTFHSDLLTGLDFFPDELDIPDVATNASTLYPTDIECRNNTDPTSTMYYKNVAMRLYQNCGCAKTTLSDMVTYCPAYDYTVNYMENGLPNRIDCYTPPTGTTPSVPTQQTVSVNSRSAPHRFFRTCGDESGSTAPCATGDNQEGDFFEYQDTGRVLPAQENFGMNSIVGPMSVTLDKALPAKAVTVELDQIYQISTTSGFYSPCPTCGKDSWFSSFSAYPTSAYGTGLQAVGFSTQRDLFDSNSTGGNYEDTIFGRACWLPPTMLPFTHYPYAATQTQRLTRLKTQAALYANGYQRDWYGFNKGALIGSFDGVSWFAVGKGRIVRSTSKKLFLAINAPFADLASPTLHVVNVQAYDGITQAAQVDYDPALHLSHPYQNEAGNCQANHMCNTDTDCVTRLGWEYMCADVQNLKTNWPQFDENASEKANTTSNLTIDQILAQKRFPSSSTKRCVYRGSGSLCIPNSTTITDLNKRKTLTCAPNFYCANVNSAGAVFNGKVSRYAANLEDIPVVRNHYFGKDANVLGRPLSYVASSLTTTLPVDVRQNLTQNLLTYEASASLTTGICLPGKSLPELGNQATMMSPYEQHKSSDSLGRTDYMSQVGACNSGLFTAYRYSSCPVMGTDGNYDFLSSTYALGTWASRARNQNSCGLDTLLVGSNLTLGADALSSSSPFRAVEAKTLSTTTVILPSVTRDACLRRAGSVCHTDLDCGPNKMHAEQVENFSLSYFGNNAEKKYYSEYLVCGQVDPKPASSDTTAYKAYSMSKNVCCREVGSDLSTYTSYTPNKVYPLYSSNEDSSTSNDDYETASYGLKMTQAPGIAPNDKYRYSRLATVENLGASADRPSLNAYQDRVTNPVFPYNQILGSAQGSNVMTPYQWKTLGEANSESCCGGGWVRKFSDGTTDWSRRDRVYLDVKNFACINSRSVMLTSPGDVASQYFSAADAVTLANSDLGDYCKDAAGVKGSCAQATILDSLTDTPPANAPIIGYTGTGDTGHFKTSTMNFLQNKDYYYYPRSADADSAITIDYTNTTGRRNLSIKIPSYITRQSFDIPEASMALGATWGSGATRVMLYEISSTNDSNSMVCEKRLASEFTSMSSPTITDAGGVCNNTSGSGCCYTYDSSTRILKVMPDYGNTFGAGYPGQNKKIALKIINATAAGYGVINRTSPGTSSYYLRRLGRMELSGIPQVNYQPIACNDNPNRIVPGLFKIPGVTDIQTSHFNQDTFSFPGSYTDPDTSTVMTSRYTNSHGLNQEPVFSANDFKCCTPLGKTTTSQAKCCSGYGKPNSAGTNFTCGLPAGTDLMVYFNRFVTNEGRDTTLPGGGLVDTDFNLITGEPKLNTIVNQKISLMGNSFCSAGKVRQGGAFGNFKLEPAGSNTNQNETIYGIVDSSNDDGDVTVTSGTIKVGYTAFMSGFRWNHHLYCDEEE